MLFVSETIGLIFEEEPNLLMAENLNSGLIYLIITVQGHRTRFETFQANNFS